jgi:hypothetical protein
MESRQSLLERRALQRRGVRAWFGAAVALAMVGAAVLAGVAVHELSYASSHPFAYGPAKVMAVGAGAGGCAEYPTTTNTTISTNRSLG